MAKKKEDTRSLIERMLNPTNGPKKHNSGHIMRNSIYAQDPVLAKMPMHVMNIALSGSLRGGMHRGVVMAVGDTQTFKSAYGAIMMSAYQQQHPDAFILFLDNEYGTTLDYFERFGGDVDRIIHIPMDNIDDMNHQVSSRLDILTSDDKVAIMVDSIGLLGSRKEIEDSVSSAETPADMTRAKALNSFWRSVTGYVNKLHIPMYVINHYYLATGGFGDPRIISGGQRTQLAVNDIWFISKSQDKDGTTLRGQFFTISIYKSRKVIKDSKFKVNVRFDETMSPYTGLWTIADELGFIHYPTSRTAQPAFLDVETGEMTPVNSVAPKRYSEKNPIETPEFWEPLLKHEPFLDAVEKRYKYTPDRKLAAFDVNYNDDEALLDMEEDELPALKIVDGVPMVDDEYQSNEEFQDIAGDMLEKIHQDMKD